MARNNYRSFPVEKQSFRVGRVLRKYIRYVAAFLVCPLRINRWLVKTLRPV